MPFIIITLVNGLKYYLQDYKGEYRFNGLIDNAIVWEDEMEVIEQLRKLEDIMGRPLLPMEIPETN